VRCTIAWQLETVCERWHPELGGPGFPPTPVHRCIVQMPFDLEVHLLDGIYVRGFVEILRNLDKASRGFIGGRRPEVRVLFLRLHLGGGVVYRYSVETVSSLTYLVDALLGIRRVWEDEKRHGVHVLQYLSRVV
jgi:hypothetical protein